MFTGKLRGTLACVVICMALVVSACSNSSNNSSSSNSPSGSSSTTSSSDSSPSAATVKKVVNIALIADPISLDPSPSTTREDRQVQNSIYDKLFDTDKDGNYVPMLAESYELSPDGLIYTIKLKQGVKFQDGTDFNADAVKFNLDRYATDENSSRKSEIKAISKVDVVDPYTVKIELSKAFSPLLSILTDRAGMMVSPEAVKKYGADYANNPVGTGPYIFVEHVKGDHVTLKKNENYWNGPVKLDEVNFRVFTNGTAAVQNLKSGQLDFLSSVPTKEVPGIKSDSNFTILSNSGMGYQGINLNTTQEPFTNKSLRQAVNKAIDRETLSKVIFDGSVVPANSPFTPGNLANGDSDKVSKPNPDEIKALLAKGGKPDGFTFKLQIGTSPVDEQVGAVIQNMLKAYGIIVEIEKYDKAALSDNVTNGKFVAAYYAWSGRPDPDQNFYAFFVTDQSRNYSRISIPELDKLAKQGREELDPTKRKAIYDQAMDIVHDDSGQVYLYHENVTFGFSNKVTGFEYVPDGIIRTAKMDIQ
jgi:peptide/nickel transport system substrate-binding protein